MLKRMKYFSTLFILSVILVACGTTNETTSADSTNEQTEEVEKQTMDETTESENPEKPNVENEEKTNVENEEETQPQTENEKAVPENDTPNQTDNEEKSPATEIQISYSINGESVVETAPWVKSDNQAFGLYVLPGYELTAEEPNNDLVYFKENDLHMMRIQILPGNSDLESLKENTIAQLEAALNEEVETVSPPADFPKNTTVLQTKNEHELVTAYLIQENDHIIKATIFTQNQDNHYDAFVQMAKNIKVD